MPRSCMSGNRAAFFTPKTMSLGLCATSVVALLIPTCLKLSPLGNDQRYAKNELDDAEGDHNDALNRLNTANAHLTEARQRIVDLDCAMPSYLDFNRRIIDFKGRIDRSIFTPTEELSFNWGISFATDRTTNEQQPARKSWDQREWVYERYYSCTDHNCGKDTSCCSAWGSHWKTVTHYYNEITRTGLTKNPPL